MLTDRVKILNTIAGQSDLAATPRTTHPSYDALNALLRGRFAKAALRPLLTAGESIEGVVSLVKGSSLKRMQLSFNFLKGFDAAQMRLIATNLPPELEELDCLLGGFKPEHIVVLADALKTHKLLTTWNLNGNFCDSEGGMAVADMLRTNTSLTSLKIRGQRGDNEIGLGEEAKQALRDAVEGRTGFELELD